MKKLIHGKWYKNSCWNTNRDFIKYDGNEIHDSFYGQNSIPGKETITRGEYRMRDRHVGWHSREYCELADMSEVIKYLPKRHPDSRKNNINNK